MKLLSVLDLQRNQLQNAVIHSATTAPSPAVEGQIYYNSTDKKLWQYNGTAWVAVNGIEYENASAAKAGLMSSDHFTKLENIEAGAEVNTIKSITVNGQKVTPTGDKDVTLTIPKDTKDLTNGAGFITADEIPDDYITEEDLTTEVAKYLPLTGAKDMTGDLKMGGNKITGLNNGVADTDAATVGQVNKAVSDLGTLFNFKGSLDNHDALLAVSTKKAGDVYFVKDEELEYVWIADGTPHWEPFGGKEVKLDGYLEIADLASGTGAGEDTAMTQKAVTDELKKKQDTITGAATTIVSNDLTPSRALVSDTSGKVAAAAVTATELGYLAGVTSKVQEQLDAKADAEDVDEIPVIKTATGSIATSSTSANVSYTGTLLNVITKIGNETVLCDVTSTASQVTVSVSQAPTTKIDITVVYAE